MQSSSVIKYMSVPLVISLIILYLCCLIRPSDIPSIELDLPIQLDKVVHFLMYLGLSGATALNYIYGEKGHINMKKMLVYAFLIPILYGGLIEILQENYFPPRSGDWADFFADALGSFAALPIALAFRKYMLKRNIA